MHSPVVSIYLLKRKQQVKYCKYGCGNLAKFSLKSSNDELVVCTENWRQCPAVREKYSIANSARIASLKENNKYVSSWDLMRSKEDFVTWNKGKTKSTDDRILKASAKIAAALIGKPGHKVSEETKSKISKTVSLKIEKNEWDQIKFCGRAKSINFEINGKIIVLKGTWEFRLANFLECKNIVWERPSEGFKYVIDGKTKLYFPDFYLVDYDLFIEIKGYITKKDMIKWSQFTKKLIVITKNNINNLEDFFNREIVTTR